MLTLFFLQFWSRLLESRQRQGGGFSFEDQRTYRNLDFVQYFYMFTKNERPKWRFSNQIQIARHGGRLLTQNPAGLKPSVGELVLKK
jgi:hypothetical protein